MQENNKSTQLVDVSDDTLIVADGSLFVCLPLLLVDMPDDTEVPEKPEHKDDNDEDGKGTKTIARTQATHHVRKRSRFGSNEMGSGNFCPLVYINVTFEVPWFTKPQDVAATGYVHAVWQNRSCSISARKPSMHAPRLSVKNLSFATW